MDNVTGRDRHLITKALAIAIATIDSAPARRQPSSDRDDMKTLLEAMVPDDVELETIANSVGWLFGGGLDLRRD